MSQPALTARIHHIEEYLKTKLIYRGSKGIHFTPAGDYLAKNAERLLVDFRNVQENVLNLGNGVKGILRIGASIYVSRYILPRLLSLFQNQYPDVEFNVTTVQSRNIINLMHNQDFHVGFTRGDYVWRYEKYELCEEQICIASKNEINLRSLPQLPRIDYRTDYLNKIALENWWKENFSQPPTISMCVDQIDICKEMVINGLGYAILPGISVCNIKGIHKFYLCDQDKKPLLRKTWMLYQQEMLEMKLVSAFVTFVKSINFDDAFFSP